MKHHSGEYGGRVIRDFKGDGKNWISGAILTPEDVASWPLGNRQALHKEGKVDWFGPPLEEAEVKARAAGSPAPSRNRTKTPEKEKVGAETKAPTNARPARARRSQ